MILKKIESLQHPFVKYLVELRTDKVLREKERKVLVFGKKMVQELPIETLLTTQDTLEIQCKEKYLVTEEVLKKITGLGQPDGYAAVIQMPKEEDLRAKNFILILDEIRDPGNLGTLVRTARGLGWEGVILTPNTVDLFNDKAIRAAKGASFHLPYARMTHEELASWNTHFYTADLKGEPLDKVTFKPPYALILSNEATGPGFWAKGLHKITIPMKKEVESLNVASSGAILLYAMRPK